MNLRTRMHVTPGVLIELSVRDRPDLTRTLEVPHGIRCGDVIEAYLLSIGVEAEHEWDRDEPEEIRPSPWWPQERSVAVAELACDVDMVITDAGERKIGDPLIRLVDAGPVLSSMARSAWPTGTSTMRVEDVNHVLVARHGVVLPWYDKRGALGYERRRISSTSRLGRMLQDLAPVPRLALLAHLDESGLLADAPHDLAIVASATESIRMILTYVGADGIAQDPESGWIAEKDVRALVRALGWESAPLLVDADPSELLPVFVRKAKLLRRVKGRVVVTNAGKRLLNEDRRTMDELARVALEPERPNYYRASEDGWATALALLALAEGSAATLGDVPAVVATGRATLGAYAPPAATCEWDCGYCGACCGGGGWGDEAASDAQADREVEWVMHRMAALSEPDRFGIVTPAMRELARRALL